MDGINDRDQRAPEGYVIGHCKAEGKRLNFPVSAADPDERTGRLITRSIIPDAYTNC